MFAEMSALPLAAATLIYAKNSSVRVAIGSQGNRRTAEHRRDLLGCTTLLGCLIALSVAKT
jgi:hypothetical protein